MKALFIIGIIIAVLLCFILPFVLIEYGSSEGETILNDWPKRLLRFSVKPFINENKEIKYNIYIKCIPLWWIKYTFRKPNDYSHIWWTDYGCYDSALEKANALKSKIDTDIEIKKANKKSKYIKL